ncbi:MAG: hypothetical protein AB7L65_08210 [Hyphomonadaceae bacterium]
MNAPHEIWFARAQRAGSRGLRLVAVSWKGYALFGVFAAAMAVGGLIFALCAWSRLYALGVVLYIAAAGAGVAILIAGIVRHSDLKHSYLDYRKPDAGH